MRFPLLIAVFLIVSCGEKKESSSDDSRTERDSGSQEGNQVAEPENTSGGALVACEVTSSDTNQIIYGCVEKENGKKKKINELDPSAILATTTNNFALPVMIDGPDSAYHIHFALGAWYVNTAKSITVQIERNGPKASFMPEKLATFREITNPPFVSAHAGTQAGDIVIELKPPANLPPAVKRVKLYSISGAINIAENCVSPNSETTYKVIYDSIGRGAIPVGPILHQTNLSLAVMSYRLCAYDGENDSTAQFVSLSQYETSILGF